MQKVDAKFELLRTLLLNEIRRMTDNHEAGPLAHLHVVGENNQGQVRGLMTAIRILDDTNERVR